MEDVNNSLDYTTSVHIWKALMHTRCRREKRKDYIKSMEQTWAHKHTTKTHEFNHQQFQRNDYQDPSRWHSLFSKPDEVEQKFTQWYSKYVVSRYRIIFNHNQSLTEGEEEASAKEFGHRGKYKPVGQCFEAFSDATSPPADEDDCGNQADKVHR